MSEANKELVRQTIRAVETLDGGLIDQVCSPGFVRHRPLGLVDANREAFKATVMEFAGVFSDITFSVEDLVAEGDRVCVRATFGAKVLAPAFGLPGKGERIDMPIIAIFRVEDGRLAEMWEQADLMGLAQQAGTEAAPV
jgi:predicted ester cyclase